MTTIFIIFFIKDLNSDDMSKIITFKPKLQKSRDHFYIHVPKQWNEDLHEFYRKRKRVKVTIEIEKG